MHRGVRFCSISLLMRSIEQLLPFLSLRRAFRSSSLVIGSLSMPRSGGVL